MFAPTSCRLAAAIASSRFVLIASCTLGSSCASDCACFVGGCG